MIYVCYVFVNKWSVNETIEAPRRTCDIWWVLHFSDFHVECSTCCWWTNYSARARRSFLRENQWALEVVGCPLLSRHDSNDWLRLLCFFPISCKLFIIIENRYLKDYVPFFNYTLHDDTIVISCGHLCGHFNEYLKRI